MKLRIPYFQTKPYIHVEHLTMADMAVFLNIWAMKKPE